MWVILVNTVLIHKGGVFEDEATVFNAITVNVSVTEQPASVK